MNLTLPGRDQFLPANGLSLHCRLFGEVEDSPVVVLHGVMGHAREWDTLVQSLAGSHHVVALDQRGHGESDWADRYRPTDLAADLIEVVGKLELTRPRVVAHSMGGLTAILAAARRPDLFRQLVIVDVGPDSVRGSVAADIAAFVQELGRSSYATFDDAYAEWAENSLARPELLHHYVTHCLRRRPDGRLEWRFDGVGLADFFESANSAELWDAVDQIRCPVLVVRGELSPFFTRQSANEMTCRLTDGRLVEIPQVGHDIGVENPEAVAAEAASFFSSSAADWVTGI